MIEQGRIYLIKKIEINYVTQLVVSLFKTVIEIYIYISTYYKLEH